MDLIAFLRNEEVDFRNRTLSDIWAYDDSQIEANHDYIQLLFPLNKPSRHSFHSVYLSDEAQIAEIRSSKVIQANIRTSANWFLMFLKRIDYWRVGYNHNQLRITRVIECLRFLVSDSAADKFYKMYFLYLAQILRLTSTLLSFGKKLNKSRNLLIVFPFKVSGNLGKAISVFY